MLQLLKADDEYSIHKAAPIELTDGFTSTYELELFATVHRAATREHTRRHDDVVRIVQSWTERKQSR
ncbi:hypothetical protein [Nocardia farcinica]|uniref:hypothetical protein n=1 Tax=Nocardia farcinica TaxID=37329 RepID=UPI0018945401|nr:hypothetical protein [Nocardia farcinica]MBF6072581.1 hypothetical protein [Nocardia farcinica]